MDFGGRNVDTFLQECEDLLAQVEEVLLDMEQGEGDSDAINRCFRIFHSIKGSGAMVGFTEVAQFTHHVETVLDKVRNGTLSVSRELIDVVLASKDHIEALLAAARGGPPVPPAMEEELLGRLAEIAPLDAKAKVRDVPQRRFLVDLRFREGCWIDDGSLVSLFSEVRALGAVTLTLDAQAVPSVDAFDPSRCHFVWHAEIITDKTANEVRDVFIFVESEVELVVEETAYYGDPLGPIALFDELPADALDVEPEATPAAHAASTEPAPAPNAEPSPEMTAPARAASHPAVPAPTTAPATSAASPAKARAKAADTMVRISSDKLDRLVNLVGELVISQSRLVQVARRIGDAELDSPVEEIERLVVELREGVLGIRMMPIGSTFARFKRLVHDLSAQLGKGIDLVTEGAETELDKSVLDQLVDPLMHLIRNSLDHGIEQEVDRVAAGKPARGTVRLVAAHAGQHVVVTIQDDGKGLDGEAIREKAITRGLISANDVLAPGDLFKLIFLPGFSTAAKVTDVSGRGVGMDVVKRQIEALRGTVAITSERGKGTTMSLKLPLTLAIIDGLLIEVAGDRYIIPLSAVTETVELPAGDRRAHNGRRAVVVRGELVPYISLRDAFGGDGTEPINEQVVILQDGDERVGMVVDHVLGNHQTVIQPLGRFYAGVDVVSGATIMGDGRVALILDIAGIVRMAGLRGDSASGRRLAA